jgi:hypothetical protein
MPVVAKRGRGDYGGVERRPPRTEDDYPQGKNLVIDAATSYEARARLQHNRHLG